MHNRVATLNQKSKEEKKMDGDSIQKAKTYSILNWASSKLICLILLSLVDQTEKKNQWNW